MSSNTWSPFGCLAKAGLTASGLLQLDTQDHEVELIRRGPMELRFDGLEPMAPCPADCTSGVWTSRSMDLTLTVTTHRLVWMNKKVPVARFLHLSNLHQMDASGGPTLLHPNASYKLTISTYTYGELVLVFRATSSNAQRDRDSIQTELQKAMDRRAWEQATKLQQTQAATKRMTNRRVGVDHVLTKNKLKHQQAQRIAEDALSGDSEQLLQEARGLLKVIQNYVALLQKHKEGGNTGSSDDVEADKLSGLLQDMGMTGALTKDQVRGVGGAAGNGSDDAEYYELLARQVADFLLPKLPAMGGILSMTDVFCLFNRARGTNLISPEDLRQACNVLDDLKLGISQRTFPSGIVVLQYDAMLDQGHTQQNRDKLISLCPTTALEVSHSLNLSPLLALEQLEDAERKGWLCRDVTLETTRFYPNRFEEW